MKVVAILQARTSSTRLPGKVLADIEGAPLLAHELRRLQRSARVDEIVVATTTNPGDDAVVDVARTEGVRWFRGDEHDVLGRYTAASREAGAQIVVRVTADCPLLDPAVVDEVVDALDPEADYASNVINRTYPVGLDVEAVHADLLVRLARLATSPRAREHVTQFVLKERPGLFVLRSVMDATDNSDLRWTVDVERDLVLVRRLYAELELGDDPRPFRDVVAYVRSRPDLATLNVAAV